MAKKPYNRDKILVNQSFDVDSLMNELTDGLSLDNLGLWVLQLKEQYGPDAEFSLDHRGEYEDWYYAPIVTIERLENDEEHARRLSRHDRGVAAASARAARKAQENVRTLATMEENAKRLGYKLVKA